MNEFEIILKIFESKREKYLSITSQSYEKAAQARDLERSLEIKLLELNNIEPSKSYDEMFKQINHYFINKWGIEYDVGYKNDILKQFIRQYKLINLGI